VPNPKSIKERTCTIIAATHDVTRLDIRDAQLYEHGYKVQIGKISCKKIQT
jgi:hypothetical protein